MTIVRVVALAAIVLGTTSPATGRVETPREWSTYELLDVRNPKSPVAFIEYRHRRIRGDAMTIQTHLLLRSGSHWLDATPHGLKWGIEDVYFVDRNHGWLITSDCAAGKGDLFRTRDRGRTWKHLSSGWSHPCSGGFRLAFVNRRTGWILSPAPTAPTALLFRTHDGGRTWVHNEGHDIPVLDDVMFTNTRSGWGAMFPWSPQPKPLYGTRNSGKKWEPQASLPRAGFSVPVFFGRTGIVMGTRRGVARFYRTNNAGSSWGVVGRLAVRDLRFPDFRALTKRIWWVYGVRDRTPVVLVTTDAGRNWGQGGPAVRGYFTQLAVAGSRAWLTTTPLQGEGELFTSGDLGRTWERVSP
jgi:photosystem II stability/assembly factor-like uncharacterized protein